MVIQICLFHVCCSHLLVDYSARGLIGHVIYSVTQEVCIPHSMLYLLLSISGSCSASNRINQLLHFPFSSMTPMKDPISACFLWLPLLAIMLGSCAVLATCQCQTSQQSLLLQLKDSLHFNQSQSAKLLTWNSNTDCCNWNGVTCDAGGRVIGLDLTNESISGWQENSTGLFSLQSLQSLNLSFNNFNANISARFGNLTNLISLNLSDAGFAGQIPLEIAHMTKLSSLDLSISGLYFSEVGSLKLENPNLATLVQNLKRITVLRLDGVNISSEGDEWCPALSSSLPNLQVLSLSNCFLSGPIHPSLENLRSLSVLRLAGNNLASSVPKFFANFSSLSALRLSSCNLQGTIPEDIFQAPTLESIDISNNKVLQGSFTEFNPGLSLRTLVLSGTQFSGRLPASIGNLRNLSRIELANCNFSGRIPSSMENLTHLVYLDFSANSFTGTIPSFQMSKDLTYVDFSHNNLTGEISTHWVGFKNLSFLDLRFNSLNGSIPASLFAIPSLQKIQLSSNQFGGQLPNYVDVSPSLLDTLDLSSNKLEGPLPSFLFDYTRLNILSLSSNKFNGTIKLDRIWKLGNLTSIDLSYNSLTVETSGNYNLSLFPQLSNLQMASCNLKEIPDLRKQSKLNFLDLSDNQIKGAIPNWIWNLGNGLLRHLNLSQNQLEELEQPYSVPSLTALDLHNNKLRGIIPTPPTSAAYVDYSYNNFTSIIPGEIGTYLSLTFFFSLSNNRLKGAIPQSLCNATSLKVLDLSNNDLDGSIPPCLLHSSQVLGVLNLKGNRLDGSIPDEFPDTCQLQTLDMSGNALKGKVPGSLANCTMLEVLNLGSNQIIDTFPCFLKNISSFRVLILRSNKFYGRIGCQMNNDSWPRLQIIDIASNNFNGMLPQGWLTARKAMKGNGNEITDHLKFQLWTSFPLYYEDSATVTSKGQEMELVKILTIFTCIDFSLNKFEGPIPEVLGQLTALRVLNLSHNAFTGRIPSSLGNLAVLESLDLSRNHLNGNIPSELVRLTFLEILNLSYNQLVGLIPTVNQFATFGNDSFKGNEGLCGLPLTEQCHNTSKSKVHQSESGKKIEWIYLSVELGFVFGLGIIVMPLVLCKRWRSWYFKHVDRVLFRIFPRLEVRRWNYERSTRRNRRRREKR